MVELNKTTVGDNSENGAHNMVKIIIDNCEVVVPEHTTILDAAKSAGIQISPSSAKTTSALNACAASRCARACRAWGFGT